MTDVSQGHDLEEPTADATIKIEGVKASGALFRRFGMVRSTLCHHPKRRPLPLAIGPRIGLQGPYDTVRQPPLPLPGSERGTRVAALFYTLIESAKHAGIEPAGYLAEATRRAIDNPGTVTLPRDLAPA